MKVLIALFLAIWLLSNEAIAFGDSPIIQANRVYCAMNRPGDKFGRLTVRKDTLSWHSGQQSRYKILKETRDYCIIELLSDPLPAFYGEAYKYIKFDWVEEELESIGAGFSKTFDGTDVGDVDKWFSYALLTPEEAVEDGVK